VRGFIVPSRNPAHPAGHDSPVRFRGVLTLTLHRVRAPGRAGAEWLAAGRSALARECSACLEHGRLADWL